MAILKPQFEEMLCDVVVTGGIVVVIGKLLCNTIKWKIPAT